MINWVDVSSYSRGDEDRIPSSWMCKLGEVDVRVHRHIHYGKETWLTSSQFLRFNNVKLNDTEIKVAKTAALNLAKRQIKKRIGCLQEALSELE